MKNFLKELFWFFVGLVLLSIIFSSARFAEGSEKPAAKISTPDETGIRVIDGDTFVLAGESVRIADIDAPELFSPKCDAEKRLARLAKSRLAQLLGNGAGILLERQAKPDRYGRTLATVLVNGAPIGSALISEGLAAPWNGKRHSWCYSCL
ncbi:MAG: thermonuclease family protein [Desulfurellales bacterium]|nr:MAG: thermonuclease family protein [Desulfurellales bacterium]